MKKLIILSLILLNGCSAVRYLENPERAERVVIEKRNNHQRNNRRPEHYSYDHYIPPRHIDKNHPAWTGRKNNDRPKQRKVNGVAVHEKNYWSNGRKKSPVDK